MGGRKLNYDVAELIETQDKLRSASAQVTEDFANLTRLHQLSLLLLRADNGLQHSLDAAVRVAVEVAGAAKGNLQVFEPSSITVKIASHRGFDTPFLRFFEFVRDDGSACAAAMRSGQHVVVEDVESSDVFDDKSRQTLLEAEVRAVISVPLTSSRGTLLGVVSVHFRTPHQPSERELTRLELVARQTADYLERRRAEEAEATLRRELEHRSSNLVAVVNTIVRQTLSTSDTIEGATKSIEGRIQTLSRVNRLLEEAGWHNIDLAEIARAELSIFPDRTNVEGGKIDLDPQTGQRFAFLMHELMTNAVKHGALSGPSGRVTVFWRLKHDGAGPVLSFRWEERDGPVVSEPRRQGFGSHLLGGIFPGGRAEYARQGFSYALDLQMPKS